MTDVTPSALMIAQRAMDRLDSHEKHCDERSRRADAFEAEMRKAIPDIAETLSKGLARVHSRLDGLIKTGMFGAITIVLALISYIWMTKVG